MKRHLSQLVDRQFDIVVVGGGIYGACIAWDAALRGLSTALIERQDFGHATSANSLKIIHGGLRYLQDRDIRLTRMMIRERSTMMRIAPHLVHVLPCITPTFAHFRSHKTTLRLALAFNDIVGCDRNRFNNADKKLPHGEIVSPARCKDILPGLDLAGSTGGAVWYDAQVRNSERLTLAFVRAASNSGASVANYVRAESLARDGSTVIGVIATDVLTGETFTIRARHTVNATGVAYGELIPVCSSSSPSLHASFAMNLVTKSISPTHAVGMPTAVAGGGSQRGRGRMLFCAPWRGLSIVGTEHMNSAGTNTGPWPVAEERITSFLDEINQTFRGANLKPGDIRYVHAGLLPGMSASRGERQVRLLRRSATIDHQEHDGLSGALSVVGVKYTTARVVAEQVVDKVTAKLERKCDRCRTARNPVFGGATGCFDTFLNTGISDVGQRLNANVAESLLYNYGSAYPDIIRIIDAEPDAADTICATSNVTKAQVLYAVRAEMAQTVGDVVFRRTELFTVEEVNESAIRECARIMAAELQWTATQMNSQIDDVMAVLRDRQPTRDS